MTRPAAQFEPVALIGIGCLFPKADSLEAFWANVRDGVDAITDVPESHWSVADYFDNDPDAPDMTYAQRGGFLNPYPFDPLAFGISPNNIEATDTTQLLGLIAAKQALADAGYGDDGKTFDRGRVSVLMGVTGTLELVIPLGARLGHPIWRRALKEAGVDDETANDVVDRISDSYVPWQESSFPGLLGNVAAGRIANRLDLHGTNTVCDAACASSLSALHLACMELQTGRADMVLTGGLDTFNDIFMYMCFSKTPALSPTGDSRPFDANADGTILGEGLGIVVVKRLEDAERDGDRIYAVIRSVGSSSDGKGNAIYAPSDQGQTRALRNAYELAGITADSIELVEAHGTGTKVGDATEITALSEVYGDAHAPAQSVALGSVKSMVGHTKAAAGVAGVIKAAMAVHHKVLPPTIKVDDPNEAIDAAGPLYVNTEKRPWIKRRESKRRAAVSAFGFGGSNFHCVIEEYDPVKQRIDWGGCDQIIALSGNTRDDIAKTIDALDLGDVRTAAWRTRNSFDARKPYRLTMVVPDNADRVVASARRMLDTQESEWTTPDGAHFSHESPGQIGVLFPGQGSQYVGMLRDLACAFPQMHDVLADVEPAIVDRIYPVPVFTDDARQLQDTALRDTRNAQPAIGAVSLGAWRVLEQLGLRAEAFAGHSYGELVALCAADVFDEQTLHQLSRLRGQLMSEGEGDRGSMLAVACSLPQVEEAIESESIDLVIANHNAPNQVVLSGATEQIELAAAAFERRGVRATKLPVSAAFHSSFVQDAGVKFAESLDSIDFAAPSVPVYANVTGEVYSGRDLLAQQLTHPVQFVRQIENMYAAGITTFVEVGPGKVLTGLVGAILDGRPHHAIALDTSRGLASTVAQLAALGHAIDLSQWDGDFEPIVRPRPAMTVPITGANYVQPRPRKAPKPAPSARPASVEDAPRRTGRETTPAPPTIAPSRQEGILALQKMQEQTAKLHQQFLESQQLAQRNISQLLGQQPIESAPAPVQPTTPAAPAPEPEPIPVEPQPETSPFETVLLETVAEKTGYPADMLDLDMQLEADLGIDSIKRVEILSAMQEKIPDAPAVNPEDLGALHTLRQIVDHMGATQPLAASRSSQPETTLFETALLETVAEKTGYPVDMLDLDMQLEADLGIDSIKRVEILSAMQEKIPDAPAVNPEDLGALHTLRQIIDHMVGASPAPSEPHEAPAEPLLPTPTEITRLIVHPTAVTETRDSIILPADAVIYVTDDRTPLAPAIAERLVVEGYAARVVSTDVEPADDPAGLIIIAPATDMTGDDLFDAFALMQRCGESLKRNGGLLALITRNDGSFGFRSVGAPVSGGLAGMIKTASHEWPSVNCKAIDLTDDVQEASVIVDELMAAGPVEVGLTVEGATTLALRSESLDDDAGVPIDPGDVIVVTGGARGVTAAVVAAVAEAWRPTLVILGRSAEPQPEPDWLAPLGDEAQIKQALLGRADAKLSPKQLDEQCGGLIANRELLRNLARFEQAGAKVIYHSVDVRDGEAVRKIIDELAPVRGLIHGAGVLADRSIEDKTREQFERVYSTKVGGALAVLEALADHDLRFIAMFSSSTGRFGRKGQVDYAIANEVLNKLAQREAKKRDGCRVVSINWGPWDGGMVTPQLKKVFADEGIEVIPLDLGAQYLLRELSLPTTDAPVETVVLGGRFEDAPPAPAMHSDAHAALVIDIDIDRHLFLRSHVIDGKAVLPVAVIMEWLAQAAMHDHPGLALIGVDDLRVLKGVVLDNGAPLSLSVHVGPAVQQDGVYTVPVELVGAHPHTRANVLLGDVLPQGAPADEPAVGPYDVAWYTPEMLFHGPHFHGITKIVGCGEAGIIAEYDAAPLPAKWIERPMRTSWITDPLALDCAFQMMIVWSRVQTGIASLPAAFASYRQFSRSFPKDGGRIVARVTGHTEHSATADLDFIDRDGRLVAQIKGYECVIDQSLNDAFARNTLATQVLS